jgi:MFS family permease
MGLEYNMQLIMSGVLNCVQLVGVISSLWTMDAIGRRPLLLWGSAVMFLSHLVISILVGKFSHDWAAYRPEGWASVVMLLVYMLAFGASWVSCLGRCWVNHIC